MLRLEFPNVAHKRGYEKLIDGRQSKEKIPTAPTKLFYGENYEEFLIEIMNDRTDNRHGVNSHLFFLMKDKEIVGGIQIRHSIDHPNLIERGGHIGYGIAPGFRKKGYGTKILKLGLPEAKKLGIDNILVTCDVDNIASVKIIENNGGVFERVTNCGEANRYWLTV